MAHKHSVYDTSLHFIIDGNTRLVKNSTEAKVTLVQYDHNSERITFELPRYIDGHDMSLCTNAQVHYINIERKTNRESVGVYECDDLQIAPDDENVVICSWLISKNATRFIGSLFFVIRFICSEDREITYSWNTARHTGLSVTDGIYNGEDVDEIVESDAFKIFNETINAANTAIENANEAAQKANDSIIHIRYSKYADGTDFVGVWTPMYDYIGIASGLTAPTDPSDYQWSRFNAKGYWTGSTEEYNAIPDDEIIDDYLYIPDDDTFFEDLESGEFVVGQASHAYTADNATSVKLSAEFQEYEKGKTVFESGTYEFRINYGGMIYCSTLSIVANGTMAINSRAIVFYNLPNGFEFSIRYDGTFKFIKRYSVNNQRHEEDVTSGDGEANITIEYRRIL